jgi:Ca2+-binding EF-hand superfamily protein
MGTGGQAQSTSSFQNLDANRDGVLSQNEASTDPSLSKQFTQIDKDGNGFISQSEFSAFETSKQQGGGSSMPKQ